jgi:hypothetical protein
MKDFSMPPALCPACGYFMDTASNMLGRGRPEVGDKSICLNCGAFLEFGLGLVLKISPDDAVKTLTAKGQQVTRLARTYINARGPIPRKETKQ